MLIPDKMAILRISHPTPNLLKIVEQEKSGTLGSIYRDHGKWTIEFPLKENISSINASEVASEMSEMFKSLGIDAYSEIRDSKLFRRGSTKFDELFEKLGKLNDVIIYPGTIWDYQSLFIFVGIFENAMESFSEWLQEFIVDSPVSVELKYYKSTERNFMLSLVDKYLFVDKLNLIKYRWHIPADKLKTNEFSVFNSPWIGSPKYLSNDKIEFICSNNSVKFSKETVRTFTCIPPEYYLIQTDYFIRNRNNSLISLSIKSLGNGEVENELYFYGFAEEKFYGSLYNLWNKTDGFLTPHELTKVKNFAFQQS